MDSAASYYWRVVSIAARNTVQSTGVGGPVALYLVISPLIGAILFCVFFGWDSAIQQWPSLLAFTLLGPAVAWFIVFVGCCVSAPYHMHLDEIAKHAFEAKSRTEQYEMEKKEVLEQMRAIVVDRDALRGKIESIPATPGDILEALVELAREGRRLSNEATRWQECVEWYDRAQRMVSLCLRKHYVNDFAAFLEKFANVSDQQSQARQRAKECSDWLYGWGGKLDDRFVNSGVTKQQLQAIRLPVAA